jgi:hypothetical protein
MLYLLLKKGDIMNKLKFISLTACFMLAMAFTFSCSEINGDDESSSSNAGGGSSSSVGGGSSSSVDNPVSSSSGDGPWCVDHENEECTNASKYLSSPEACADWLGVIEDSCPAGFDRIGGGENEACIAFMSAAEDVEYECRERCEEDDDEYECRDSCINDSETLKGFCGGNSARECYRNICLGGSGPWCVDHNLGMCSDNPDLLSSEACDGWDGVIEDSCPDDYDLYH